MDKQLTPEQQELQRAWVLSSKEQELAAWNKLYDSLYPRPDSSKS